LGLSNHIVHASLSSKSFLLQALRLMELQQLPDDNLYDEEIHQKSLMTGYIYFVQYEYSKEHQAY
jgi:hypothetical protein